MNKFGLVFTILSLIFLLAMFCYVALSQANPTVNAFSDVFTPGNGDTIGQGYHNATSSHSARVSWYPAPYEEHWYAGYFSLGVTVNGRSEGTNNSNSSFCCNSSTPENGSAQPDMKNMYKVEYTDKGTSGSASASSVVKEGQTTLNSTNHLHSFTCDW